MFAFSGPEWMAVLVTAITVLLAIFFHFEAISILNRWSKRQPIGLKLDHHHRPTLLKVVAVLLFVHIAEIWWFACAYWFLGAQEGLGSIVGYASMTFLEYVYFSAATYTTVGWGDLYPAGPIRFLAGTEALVGFMLITWSASFTYLVMARMWGARPDSSL